MPKYFVPIVLLLTLFLAAAELRSAEVVPVAPANYDEAKVQEYTLPDPLTMQDGRKVTTAEQWMKERRPELLKLFEEHVYGKATLFRKGNKTFKTRFEYLNSKPVYDGKGIQHQFQIVWYQGNEPDENAHRVDVLVYTPKLAVGKKVPAFVSLNFQGNHTTDADPDIRMPVRIWNRSKVVYSPAKEEERGAQANRWPMQFLLERGYACVTAYYCDIEPDVNGGYLHGVRKFLYKEGEKQALDEANTIATWAWGLGEMLDGVEHFQDKLGIDPTKTVVVGHSRLGKTSLWAGAIDQRFAIVISNDSGCGGAALSRRNYGETVHRINVSFPHWFCDNFKKYNLDVNSLPVDQHQLIALAAPRPVYVASATEDRWADPKGEFLSAYNAGSVYKLFGTSGFGGVTEPPQPDLSVGGIIGYHNRTGGHGILEPDWKHYCDFADKHLK
ncbi:MAG: acetylxylan esterase [Planctomycetaceae bacterium]|nr:acetylxylan esterase [Planctomycetaceae bacterium]